LSRVIESMTRVEIPGYTVRVWREVDDIESTYACHTQIDDQINEYWNDCSSDPRRFNLNDLIYKIEQLGRINAIEIINRYGNGVVYYPEWP
jgi:hypothetical protein